ncbi:hypothetical protein A5732_15415 [Mycobacterium colombiense]|nr:hypothetical protein A5732_15415 [Mycobacterium colombiense]
MEALESLRKLPDSRSFGRARQLISSEGAAARLSIQAAIDALQAMIDRSDPLHLYGALHMWDVRARSLLTAPQIHGSDAMLEFFAGLVTSRPESDVVANLRGRFDPQIVLDAENQLRTIAELQASIDFADAFERPARSSIERAIELLNLERHFDRMAGFDRHLRRIADAIFGLVDETAKQTLGFKLSDALRFADIYSQRLLEHWQSTSDRIVAHHMPSNPGADEATKLQWMVSEMLAFVLDAAAPVEAEDADELIADRLGLSSTSFDKLVAALATPLGSQQICNLHEDNHVRNHPILLISDGQWMWCRPEDFVHCMLDWAFDVCQQSDKLLKSFDKARQTVAERMPGQVLASIFGEERTFSNVTYPDAESDAEADIVMSLPGAHLIVECKGGRITAAARRGAPGRVEKHADQMITKGADQNLRTANAIKAGLPLKAGEGGKGRTVPVERDDLSLGIIVTLDRIDPFNTLLGRPSSDSLGDRSWILTLADLLLIADVLPNPAELFAYAHRRTEMVRSDSHRVLVEADALGSWCEDRLASFKPVIPGRFVLVDQTSKLINDYFALNTALNELVSGAAAAEHIPRPTADVPPAVLDALDRLFAAGERIWTERCDQAFEVRPSDWEVFKRRLALAEHPGSATSRIARKNLAQAQRGFMVAGSLPVKLMPAGTEPVDDENFLVIRINQITP